MSTSSIPTSPSLEYYRKQARALHKSVKSGDSASVSRVQAQLSKYAPGAPFKLSDAQWILAREHGFASWPRFKKEVEDRATGNVSEETSTMAPATASLPKSAIKSNAVAEKTGKSWDEWFQVLDDAGAASMNHQQIVAIVREYGAGSWWQQMVTVTYEQARGLRVLNQSCAGNFQVSVSKTLDATAEQVFQAWNDEAKRKQWLPEAEITIRKATSPKSLRITWHNGNNFDVMIYPKGESRSSCTADHKKLDGPEHVEQMRAHWSSALARLKEFVEA